MNRPILFLAGIILGIQAFSQQKEGVVRYLKTHDWVKKLEAVDYISKERKEKLSYVWGNDAEWKEYTLLYYSGQKTRYEDSEEKAETDYEGYSWRKDEFMIFRDFETKKIRDIIKLLGKVYIIEDTLVPQDWKILNDIKEVAGHICMDASWTDTIKDQKVIAWFALDIPVSAGPERFCGLPGMILEVDVNDGAMIITADRIEEKSPGDKMEFPVKVKGKRITEADYIKKITTYISDKRAAEEIYFWGGMRY
jgi:GLPGLI family protein